MRLNSHLIQLTHLEYKSQWLFFCIFMGLCNYHYNLILEHFCPPLNHVPISCHFPFCSSKQPLIYLLSWVLPILDIKKLVLWRGVGAKNNLSYNNNLCPSKAYLGMTKFYSLVLNFFCWVFLDIMRSIDIEFIEDTQHTVGD